MKNQEATASQESTTDSPSTTTQEYGLPIYMVVQGAGKTPAEINEIVASAIEEAAEYKSVLYIVIQSGNPPQPPPCPPGGCQ